MDSFKTREILDIVLKQNSEISHLIIDYARNVRMTKTMDIRDKQVITGPVLTGHSPGVTE